MNRYEFDEVTASLSTFCQWIFADSKGKPLKKNLLDCVDARLSDAKRKTHQPAAMRLARHERDADGLRQRLNRTNLSPRWSDQIVRRRLYDVAAHVVPGHFAWLIDDTGLVKKGNKSPGVARQYTGTAGKVCNCQILVSTHLAGWNAAQPLEMDLYLPKTWTADQERRQQAGIPDDINFATKPQIALSQIKRMLDAGQDKKLVVADNGYGKAHHFRQQLEQWGLRYMVGVQSKAFVWRQGQGPVPPEPRKGKVGRPQVRWQLDEHKPISVLELARELGPEQWHQVKLSAGRHQEQTVRMAAVRVHDAHGYSNGAPAGEEQWLLIEWPAQDEEPRHYWLSNMAANTDIRRLTAVAFIRWRVERNYQDLKQEVGLDHYEGRRWIGMCHHLSICMVAHAFLLSQRVLFPPQTDGIVGQRQEASSGVARSTPWTLRSLQEGLSNPMPA